MQRCLNVQAAGSATIRITNPNGGAALNAVLQIQFLVI